MPCANAPFLSVPGAVGRVWSGAAGGRLPGQLWGRPAPAAAPARGHPDPSARGGYRPGRGSRRPAAAAAAALHVTPERTRTLLHAGNGRRHAHVARYLQAEHARFAARVGGAAADLCRSDHRGRGFHPVRHPHTDAVCQHAPTGRQGARTRRHGRQEEAARCDERRDAGRPGGDTRWNHHRLQGLSEIQHHPTTPGLVDAQDGRQERLRQGPDGDAGGLGRPAGRPRAHAVAGAGDAPGVVLPPDGATVLPPGRRALPSDSSISGLPESPPPPVTCHQPRRGASRASWRAPCANSHRLAWTTLDADCSVLNTVYIYKTAFEMPSGSLTPVLPKTRDFPVVASQRCVSLQYCRRVFLFLQDS
ncbi:hypothetical protein FJT64_024740 [Amphibalanus amphitrite]|uniref:Uncharacterized protein n=1 Tax=Amphibalanus amphitrite TaxID=1232801 RepID=A0A6A4WHE9_AMPAM|nr:hypothetical protein FJT64_024740 [Amphibalanus amphitrite]